MTPLTSLSSDDAAASINQRPITDEDVRALEEALPDFVFRQRWFAAKNARPGRVRLLILGAIPDGPEGHVLTEIAVATGEGEQRYLLPLCVASAGNSMPGASLLLSDGVGFTDGLHDPALVRAILTLIADGRDVELNDGGRLLSTASTVARDRIWEAVTVPVEAISVLSGEQSNTSIMIGGVAILKLYRRLRDGIQPELEMTQFLTERTDFTGTPTFLGSITLVRPNGETAAVAALFERVENEGDAWAVVTADLVHRLRDGTAGTMAPIDVGAVIGLRTGEMHRALATVTGLADFDPEPIDAPVLHRFVEHAKSQAAQSLAILRQSRERPALDPLRVEIDRLIASGAAIEQWFDGFLALSVASHRTRIHGDYHLGQLLVSKGDVVILDFEGEPGAPLDERREKSSPLRDVAGMIRSFDYAAFAAFDAALSGTGEHSERMQAHASQWRDGVTTAFLTAWGEASGIDLGEDSASRLLDLFTLQKAFYELAYEATSRPAWLPIPLRGIISLLEKRRVLS